MGNPPNIKILFYERSLTLHSIVMPALLEAGFEALGIRESGNVLEKVKTKKFSVLIYDGDDEHASRMITAIKSDPDTSFINIIVFTNPSPKEYLVQLFGAGICGVILKPFVKSNFFDTFLKLVKKTNPDGFLNRRCHIRVDTYPWDKAHVNFHTRDRRLIKAKVCNVSMGGILCQSDDNLDSINDGTLINRLHVYLNEYHFTTEAVLVGKQQDYLAFRFKNLIPASKINLGKYIYTNINRYLNDGKESGQ